MRPGPRYTRAMEAVDQQTKFGDWTVLRLSERDGKRVIAICGRCQREQDVDIHDLRRLGRRHLGGRGACQACANRMKRGTYARLPAGESLLNTFEHEYRKTAAVRKLVFELSRDQFRALVFADCTYCGAPPAQKRSSNWDFIWVTGIDRVDRRVGYIASNCVSCCKTCNYMKHTLNRSEFLTHVQRIAEHNQ